MLRTSFAVLVIALAGSAAGAAIGPADASALSAINSPVVQNSTVALRGVVIPFTVYTGIATAANGLVLLESGGAPVRDDVVGLGSTAEAINDYIPAAGSVRRFVTSSVQQDVTPGVDVITITVFGRNADDAPADLWPSGLATGGNPLVNGAFGIGLNLGPNLGNAPLNLAPDNALQHATLQWVTDGVLGPEITIPPTLFGPAFWNWGGVLGLTWGNGATGTGVQSDITLRLVIPTPAAGAVLGMGSLCVLRRRRRA